MSVKVKLRQKSISKEKVSLYLDFYPPIHHPELNKATRREFLGYYLYEKPKSQSDKQHNKETLQLAEQIRVKRDNQLNKPEIYNDFEKQQLAIKEKGEKSFVEYFKSLGDKRKSSNHDNWVSAFHYFENFTGGRLRFADLDEKFCNSFKDFLLNTQSIRSYKVKLAHNSAVSYFNKFKAVLRQAYKDGNIQTDLNARIQPIKQEESIRNFLTIEELNTLVKTDCPNKTLKLAALFSSLTGLRFSDIQKLKWQEIEFIKGQGYYIHFRQQKTKGVELLPISEQAYPLLGQPEDPGVHIFKGLKYSATLNSHLFRWITKAGIKKDITFHCFRHSYATLQLLNGTDIYTVSKMLGHREIKTTQIYAKIVDQTKRKAAGRIKLKL